MRRQLGSLRVRLAVAIFAATCTPVLVLLVVIATTQVIGNVEVSDSPDRGEIVTVDGPNWVIIAIAVALMAPVLARLAWWLAGRAIEPIAEAAAHQEQLIEEASHELRTPLAVLSANAEVLLEHPNPTLDIYREGLRTTQSATERITRTVDALLSDARRRARSMTTMAVDLTDLVGQVIHDLEPLATAAGISLEQIASRAVPARVDPSSVERALTNLISNALSAAPAGTTVSIRVSEHPDNVEIAVTDQGPGVPAADQADVFDRYWRQETGNHRGTGIGLQIVRHVAHAHGGDVTLRSPVRDGRGTQFVVTLAR